MFTTGLRCQLLLILICSHICSTLFYTNSRENDYPRIGKRLEMFEVLKGKYSSPKYKETYKTTSPDNEELNAFDSEHSWNLGKHDQKLYGRSKLERQVDESRPILIAVQHKSEKHRKSFVLIIIINFY
jgi:hypothetical protein